MKIFKRGLIIIAVVVLLAIGFLTYMGLFLPMKVYESKMGPFTVAYESFVGPYSKTGPVFAKVYGALKTAGIASPRGLGIYYDDPSRVPADKLRSDCGVVIEKSDMAKFNVVRAKLKVKQLAKKDSIVAEFPIRNALSYMIGPMKAYPVLMNYAREKGYKMSMSYELYDEAQGKIFFVFVITK